MKQFLAMCMWTMLAGSVIIPIADYVLQRKSSRFQYNHKRTAIENHDDWIAWWLLQNHPGAKNAQRKK